jgi:glutathione peroxidase
LTAKTAGSSPPAMPVGAGKISWNFEKFILGRNGEAVARFAPKTNPDDLEVIEVIEE